MDMDYGINRKLYDKQRAALRAAIDNALIDKHKYYELEARTFTLKCNGKDETTHYIDFSIMKHLDGGALDRITLGIKRSKKEPFTAEEFQAFEQEIIRGIKAYNI